MQAQMNKASICLHHQRKHILKRVGSSEVAYNSRCGTHLSRPHAKQKKSRNTGVVDLHMV